MHKFAKARGSLIQSQPFFGALSYRLKFEDAPAGAVDTFRLVGDTISCNPEWLDRTDTETLMGLLATTVLKPALGHPMRRAGRDERTWIEASHIVTNLVTDEAKLRLPDGAPLRREFAGLPIEEVFAKLSQEQRQQQQQQQQEQPQPDANGAEEDAAGGAADDGDGSAGGAGGTEAEGTNQGGAGEGPSDVGGCGSFADQPNHAGDPASAAELAQAADDWKISTIQAGNAARAAGQLPGGVAAMIAALKQPRVDWKDALRDFFTRFAPTNHNWSRPDRRFIERRIYLPTLKSPAIDAVAVIVDTSGSTRHAWEAFFTELTAIAEDTRPGKVVVIYCDAAVSAVQEYTMDELPIVPPAEIRSGGTDMTPAFDRLAELDIDPACVVCLTDLEFWRWPAQPDAPVLWVSVGEQKAPYGDVVPLTI